MAKQLEWCPSCGQPTTCLPSLGFCGHCGHRPLMPSADPPNFDPDRDTDLMAVYRGLTPSADLPACRDEDPAQAAVLAACYPDLPEYQHPEDEDDDAQL